MGARGIEFDSKKFEFIGVPTEFHPVCALTRASGLTSMERWFAAKEPAKLGGIGPGTGLYQLLNACGLAGRARCGAAPAGLEDMSEMNSAVTV